MELVENNVPRRSRLDLLTPIELAIFNCNQDIERLPASEKLTKAQTLISEAIDLVADFIEGIK